MPRPRHHIARLAVSLAVGLGMTAVGSGGPSVSAANPTTGTDPAIGPSIGVEPIQWELVGTDAYIRGWLALDDGVDAAGHVVELHPAAGEGPALATGVTDSHGTFAVPVATDTAGSFVYEVRVVGDATVTAMTSTPVVVEVSTAWTQIDLASPESPVLGDQVLIAGQVLAQGLPVVDHFVSIERHGSDGVVALGQAGTDSTGSFEIVDVPTVEDWYVYAVHYEFGQGGTFYSSTTAYVDVFVSATAPAVVTVQAPARSIVGRPLTVSGRLVDRDGAPIPDREISVGGVGTVTTSGDGSFAVTVVPMSIGATKYTASFAGDSDFSAAGAVTGTVDIAAVPTSTSLVAPATAIIGAPVDMSGAVLDDRGDPVAGGSVLIRRVNASGTTTTLATVTSDAVGRFSLTTIAPSIGMVSYTAAYLGSTTRERSQASTAVSVTLVPTATSVTAPATATIGAPFTINGTVSDALGRVVTGGSVRIQRTDANGTVTLGTTTTTPTGSYSLATTATTAGSATYTATYLGDATRAASHGASTVNVTRIPTTVSVNSAKITKGRDKGSYTIVVTLGTSLAGRTVEISATPAGGTETVIAGGASALTVVYKPSAPTVITARFAGDARYAPSSATITLTP